MSQRKEKELDSIRKELKRAMVKKLSLGDIKPEDIRDDEALFGGNLPLDSLDAAEIVVLVQRNFGVEIEDIALGQKIFQSVNTLAQYIYDNSINEEQKKIRPKRP